MYRIAPSSFRETTDKKAPLNRLIHAAREAHSRNVREATLPTLGMLRNELLSGLAPDDLEMATRPGRRFRSLLERATHRIAKPGLPKITLRALAE